jgi:hypothetical protein
MNSRKTLAAVLALTAPLLFACKSGEAAHDGAPEHLTGTIGLKFDKAVPVSGGTKCTYGGFWVTSATGEKWDVCAPTEQAYTDAAEGQTFTR